MAPPLVLLVDQQCPKMLINCGRLLRILILLLIISNVVVSQSIIKKLPGYDGDLPIKLETGYIGVGEADEVQLFYYFVESEGNPKEDPLVLWLTGGPGCSAFSGLVYEIGPLSFDYTKSSESEPTFLLNPYSWTKVANIIFVDAPVGTGFSYATTSEGYNTGDKLAAAQNYEFLRKWLMKHPQFLKNQLYIAGDSYSGMIVPIVVQEISDGNEAGLEPLMDLQRSASNYLDCGINGCLDMQSCDCIFVIVYVGPHFSMKYEYVSVYLGLNSHTIRGYMLGNPMENVDSCLNSRIPFAHRVGLISDEIYESTKRSCNGEYVNIDLSNAECVDDLLVVMECMQKVFTAQILEPTCSTLSPKPTGLKSNPSFPQDNFEDFLISPPNLDRPWCRNYNYLFSYIWANNKTVQNALHIREGTIKEWVRCNDSLSYTYDVSSTIEYHRNLTAKGYRVLIYSGDHDMVIPYLGTQAWIESLNLNVTDDWRPWFVDGQVAGFTVDYNYNKYRLRFATVKGGGHTAPEYKPEQCLAMVYRWFAYYPL